MSNMWHGELVRLRAIEPDDLPIFRRESVADADDSQLYDDSRYPPLTVAAHGARMTRTPSDGSDDLTLAIESVDGDELAGSLSAYHCDHHTGTFEIGFGIFTVHRRRGYISEAVQILMRYYFEELRYQKVNTIVNAFTEPSLAVHRHLGFVKEGRRRRVGFSGSEHFDDILFGMTVEEFYDHFSGPKRPSAT